MSRRTQSRAHPSAQSPPSSLPSALSTFNTHRRALNTLLATSTYTNHSQTTHPLELAHYHTSTALAAVRAHHRALTPSWTPFFATLGLGLALAALALPCSPLSLSLPPSLLSASPFPLGPAVAVAFVAALARMLPMSTRTEAADASLARADRQLWAAGTAVVLAIPSSPTRDPVRVSRLDEDALLRRY